MKKSGKNTKGRIQELNIQPNASILNVFSRLNYKARFAIAEFVDNSTQSYFSNANKLKKDKRFDKLRIDIKYDEKKKTLQIADNAFGMEIDRFKDAILLDARNSSQTGRNEFGMGLKTAASWFGNKWSVISTQYGSENTYSATIDINVLKKKNVNYVSILNEKTDKNSHGTTILIEDLTKFIAPRSITKLKDMLASMYRRDINDNNIEIRFNNELITFEDYPILTNFRGKKWKKKIDFSFNFNKKKFHVDGFVAIMSPGSFSKAGFALFRQNRVVLGGVENNYKPESIFIQHQSQISLKLFGEINMNDFPVNQAKDGFIWDDGLEDIFVENLKKNIKDYISIADLSKKARDEENQYSIDNSNNVQKKVEESVKYLFVNEKKELESDKDDDVSLFKKTILNAKSKDEKVGAKRKYTIPFNRINKIVFNVQWTRGSNQYWIEYSESNKDNYNVSINICHPFFLPYSNNNEFKVVLEQFVIAFICSEREAKKTSSKNGYIEISVMKNFMNRYLENIARAGL